MHLVRILELLFIFGAVTIHKNPTFTHTSLVQIINGHKVVINETEYKKEDENGGAFVKISVIDFRPAEESGETTSERDIEPNPSNLIPEKDRESLEDSHENEIPKTNEVGTNGAVPEKIQAPSP